MKTMLHRSFNTARCKTALKLAASRIKLLKKKKEVDLRQLKTAVAQLLQCGDQHTAMIRVEHVIWEEMTLAAYDLIEIYCEMVVVHLQMIESQKNCPIDLKEAITGIIFASPRCADIPELLDVRKHFTAKYGKEFVAAAIELHPQCGVNRIMVEKLSAVVPDASTKLKVLSAIAHDYNIEWQPSGLKEKDPEPLQFIPHAKNNEKGNMIHVVPLRYQVVPQLEKKHEIPPQYHDNESSGAGPSVNVVSTGGPAAEVMGYRRSSARIESIPRPAWQNWNMEFEDASAAAQAAAESAERASMAARAAAELSSRGKLLNHNSTTSTGSSGFVKYVDWQVQDEHTPRKAAVKKSLEERSSSLQAKQKHSYLQEDVTENAIEVGLGKEHSDSKEQDKVDRVGNRKSAHTGLEDAGHEFEGSASAYHPEFESEDVSDENPFYEETTQVRNMPGSSDHQSSASVEEHGIFSNLKGPTFDETVGSVYEENLYNWNWESREKTSHSSSHYGVLYDEDKSRSGSSYEEEVHVKSDKLLSSVGFRKAPSAFVEHGSMQVEKEADTDANSGAVFDEYGEEDDDLRIYLESERKMQAAASSVTSPNRKWLAQFSIGHSGPPANSSTKLPISSEHLGDLGIVGTFKRSSFGSQSAEPQPASYDDLDEPSSDEETDKFKNSKKSDSWTYLRDTRQSVPALRKTDEWTRESNVESLDSGSGDMSINRRSPGDILKKSSSNDWKESLYRLGNEVIDQQRLQSSGSVSQLSPQPMISPKSTIQTAEVSTNLNLGSLMGGLRNKSYTLPPYRLDPLTGSSASGMGAVESVGAGLQLSSDRRFEKQSSRYESTGARKPALEYTRSNSDTVKVKPAQKGYGDISKAYSMKTDAQMDERFRLEAPTGYFDSGDSSFEEDAPKKTETTRGRLVGVTSRRTRGSALSSVASMDSNSGVSYDDESSSVAATPGRKPSSPSSQGTGTLSMSQTRTLSSGLSGNPQVVARGTEEVKSRPVHRGKMTLQEETWVPSVVERRPSDSHDMKSGDSVSKNSSISTPNTAPPSRVDSTTDGTRGTGTLSMSQTRTVSSGLSGNPRMVARGTEEVKSRPVHSGKMTLQEETWVPSKVERRTSDSQYMKSGDSVSKNSSISTPNTAPPSRVDSTTDGTQGTGALSMSQTRTVSSGLSGNPRMVARGTEEVKSRPVYSGKMTLQEETWVPSVVGRRASDSQDRKSGDSASKNSSISTPSPAPPSRVDSTKKPSHVHPKLPDYDALAAYLQSLRTDRR